MKLSSATRLSGQFLRTFETLTTFARVAFLLSVGHGVALAAQESPPRDLVSYVHPLVGTAIKGDGGALPSVGPPFAMTNFIATTNENAIGKAPYLHDSDTIIGFMGTHQPGQAMGDYGFITMWPCLDQLTIEPEARKLRLLHETEIARPDFYSAELATLDGEKKMQAQFTATEHCGFFAFDLSSSETAYIAVETSRDKGLGNAERHRVRFRPSVNATIDALRDKVTGPGYVSIDAVKGEISGYNPEWQSFYLGPELKNFKGYFLVQFETPFSSHGTWNGPTITPDSSREEAKWTGGYAAFTDQKVIRFKVATSFISLEQCRRNLEEEMPDWDFEAARKKTRAAWEKRLATIQVTGTETQKAIFYTAMYHALMLPRSLGEQGRYYSAFDDKVHEGQSYTDFSLWDTFRAEHPLLHFIAPDHVPKMVNSLIQSYEQSGWLPMWPNPGETNIMIGTHADSVIADAIVKGVPGIDLTKAYAAVRKDAFTPPNGDTGNENFIPNFAKLDEPPSPLPAGAGNHWWGRSYWRGNEARGGLTWYLKLGYVPVDMTNESVSRTLEYAYDDFCVAQVAAKVGATDDFKVLMDRTRNYRNVFNPATGFMAARWSTGEFKDGPFTLNGKTENGFTEGGEWTYLFCAMQDVPGLAALMGGNDAFAAKLDANFAGGYYQHGNEPGHHYTYLYDYVGQPWKTQQKVREYTLSRYKDAPDGLMGNDDCGQMSAWYIFSALGFYPVCPGKPEYAIGSPLFPESKLNLPGGKTLILRANHVSDANCYIQSVTINGTPLTKPFFTHEQLMAGGVIVFEMGGTPNPEWGAK